MVIKNISQFADFKKEFNRLDKKFQERVLKLVHKIVENPTIGKPMRYGRRGTREVYLKPYRLSYLYAQKENEIILLDIYHKKKQ